MKNVIIGTAGHIDHGKSALVEALTGTHPDRLEEEKRRGITIDLGFAFLELEGVRFGFVDVPGHEKFVRNMLAGVGGFDLVLLVVAADESIKPQTGEHFDICKLLNIPQGLAVVTKADLVGRDVAELVRLEVEEFLKGSFLERAPVVTVSAKSGAGLERLKAELLRMARDVAPKDPRRHFRLPIDRAFAIKGFGTVVTGTLVSGAVQPGDEVEVLPGGRRLRVRGVHSGNRAVERAEAGQRTAVNLAGIEVGELRRGMVLVSPGLFEVTRCLDVRVTLLPSARKLKNRARVHFHQGTAETVAEIALLAQPELKPGESGLAQLRLEDEVMLLPGDRFILRQFSPVITIGGGVVLDNLAPRYGRRRGDARARLGALETGTREDILVAHAAQHPHGMNLKQIVARTGWLESEVRSAVEGLQGTGTLEVVGEQSLVVALRTRVAEVERGICELVETFHRVNPLAEGLSKEELRARVLPRAREEAEELFRAALERLVVAGALSVAGDVVKRAGREIALRPEEQQARDQIERAFESAGLAVPAVKQVLARLPVEARRAQKLVQILVRERALVKVTEELLFHSSALARLREMLAGYKKEKGERLSVGAFKELAGISRKYAIPLLEYLDRERITRRAGDERIIL